MLPLHPRWLIACSLLLAAASAALAANLPIAVSPVAVKLNLATEFGALTVSNRGNKSTGIEAEAFRVRWVNGQEQYEVSKDFVVSPPSFRLAANKDRLVRFRYTAARQESEGLYRLFIRQLPEGLAENQINMVVSLGVPIFVAPLNPRPALAVDGRSSELLNPGNVTLNVFRLEGKDCPEDARKSLTRLSPGQKFVLQTEFARCATSAQTDRGRIALTPP